MRTVTFPDPSFMRRVGAPAPGTRYLVWDVAGSSPAPAEEIDLVVLPYMAPAEVLEHLDGVRVGAVQTLSLGYDRVQEHLPSGVVFCNAAGAHETTTAEHAIALALASRRELDRFVRNQEEIRAWDQRFSAGLVGARVVIVGVGGVGNEIERLLAPFTDQIVRVARSERIDDRGAVHAVGALPRLVAEADVVFLAIPLTEETRGIVDDTVLSAMPDGSLLVNVARGGVVDTDALLRATGTGRISAALDVTDPEPLPRDHPLWTAPGVIVTPHVAGRTRRMWALLADLVRGQIAALEAGAPLSNQISFAPATT
jgi:phosphoglycerate dehydrogenase-like enzyme